MKVKMRKNQRFKGGENFLIKNKYKINGDIVEIYLDRKNDDVLITITDIIGFNKIKNLNVKWYAHFDPKLSGFYVVGYLQGTGRKGKKLKLHRVIVDAKDGEVVDHINGDTLNNSSLNLRATSHTINQLNRHGLPKNNTSGYSNIRFRENCKKWQVYFSIDGKFKSFGHFTNLEEAIDVADSVRKWRYNKAVS
jgi:hypothetical protein